MEHHRALWCAVVLQAYHDIETLPIDSTNYEQAVAFFAGAGEWAESRQSMADLIGVHPDDLRRSGLARIAARRLAEGLPAVAPPAPRPGERPRIALVAVPGVEVAKRKYTRRAPGPLTAEQIALHATIRARPQSAGNPFMRRTA